MDIEFESFPKFDPVSNKNVPKVVKHWVVINVMEGAGNVSWGYFRGPYHWCCQCMWQFVCCYNKQRCIVERIESNMLFEDWLL